MNAGFMAVREPPIPFCYWHRWNGERFLWLSGRETVAGSVGELFDDLARGVQSSSLMGKSGRPVHQRCHPGNRGQPQITGDRGSGMKLALRL